CGGGFISVGIKGRPLRGLPIAALALRARRSGAPGADASTADDLDRVAVFRIVGRYRYSDVCRSHVVSVVSPCSTGHGPGVLVTLAGPFSWPGRAVNSGLDPSARDRATSRVASRASPSENQRPRRAGRSPGARGALPPA